MRVLFSILCLVFLFTTRIYAQWVQVSPMSTSRAGHVAAALNDGRLLVAGGWDYNSNLLSSEIYDPQADSWTSAGDMSSEHYTAQAVTLNDGKVLVISGFTGSFNTETCDLYDPATDTWSSGGFLTYGRSTFTATLLNDGRVLVVGGYNGTDNLKYCEIYDPVMNSWSQTDSLSTGRSYHTASLLADGRVLVTGGFNPNEGFQLSSTEIYDPVSDTWSDGPSMTLGRDYHAASVLNDGRVLVTGGRYFNGSMNFAYNGLTETEIYDPVANNWVFDESLPAGLSYHSQVTIGDGSVLVIAGVDSSNYSSESGFTTTFGVSYKYDPAAGEWTEMPLNQDSRYEMTASVLSSGDAIVTGGVDASAELFDLPLSFGSISAEGGIKIFPNPAHSNVNVSAGDAKEKITWSAFDLAGREIPVSVNQSVAQVSTLHFSENISGVILIQGLSESGKIYNSRIILK